MSTLLLTIILAFVVVVIAICGLAIGWLLKGKSNIQAGACGRDPTKKQNDKSCGTKSTCSLCEDKETKTKKIITTENKKP